MEKKHITAALEREHLVVKAMKGLPESAHAGILVARVHGALAREHGIKHVAWHEVHAAVEEHLTAPTASANDGQN